MAKTFLLEPELIAATENVFPDLNNDLISAKNLLKQETVSTGDSLYDHLTNIVHGVIKNRPPSVGETFEQYSWEIKLEKLKPDFDILHGVTIPPRQLAEAERLDEMFKTVANDQNEDVGEEEGLNLEEEMTKADVVDLIEHNFNFRQAGFGLPESECFKIYIALKWLAAKEPVCTVRFFGKIYGTKADYYVAETDLTEDEMNMRIREFDMKEMPGEGEARAEGEDRDAEEAKREDLEGETEAPKEPVPPKLPLEPRSSWTAPPPPPSERPGQGVNEKVYWACNRLGDPWVCLPDVAPPQLAAARGFVRAMTGDLDAEVVTFPPFDGTERHYLRAQVARIAAAACVSPRGYYTFGSGEEEEDVDAEGEGDMRVNINPSYEGHNTKDLLDTSLTYWVHHRHHILKQGRTIWWNPNAISMDEAAEEEDEDVPPQMEPETGPSLLTSLSEDAKLENLNAWSARAGSRLAPDRAVVLLKSNLWPGAAAYAYDKKTECMYVGWGLKYTSPNYSPPQLPRAQEEYPIGPEVMEMADPTFADEEAYRIAHLPPEPRPVVAEGEGEEEENEEGDD
ncbi:Radial spoke head protein 4 homolog A [Eumeta japonica]|uniref:Radial spoke head protein 4 homolog A n=1 Tax=Eumeta variegata TaxID=151549 RepID=A0A4C1YUS5_EUMVA|nr:Radial spoke head protein 4 homolog A [Eumeta japonica]